MIRARTLVSSRLLATALLTTAVFAGGALVAASSPRPDRRSWR